MTLSRRTFAAGLVLKDRVPAGHKVALTAIAAGAPVLRYGIAIGYATKPIAAGSWVHERLLEMPAARSLEGLPIATVTAPPLLSTTIVVPSAGPSFWAIRRARMSVVPPAGNGTT